MASRGKRRPSPPDVPQAGPGGSRRLYEPPQRSSIREMFESICVAVILAFFVRTFVVQAFKIPSGSMEPNLLIGDHLLVNKFVSAPTLSSLEKTLLPIDVVHRGDIIVFKHPKTPERDLIKRTIGLPGETIELRDRRVYVNGKPLDEPYARYLFPEGAGDLPQTDVRRNFGPLTIPDGHVLHDGRQSGQLRRQPILGSSAARLRKGQGLVPVHVVWRR